MKLTKMKNAAFLAFTIILIYSNGSSQWVQTNGPAGITINTLIKFGNIILAGTETYGVYKSTNDGATWINSSVGIENAKVTSFAYLNGNFYAGLFGPGSMRGVVKSTDDGQSWTQTGGPIANQFIKTVAAKDNYIFAGFSTTSGSGLYRTSDFGASWIALGVNSITKADLIFVNGNSIIVGDDNFIWYSNNNGDGWNLVYQYALSGIYGMAAIGNTILAARSALKSTDNGITWTTRPSPGLTYTLTSYNNSFYAGTTTGIYKSTDFGTSWISTSTGLGNGTIKALINDGHSLYAAGENISAGVYKSTDAGSNWQAAGTGFASASTIRSMVTKGPYIFAAVEDDGVYKSSDNGNSWTKTGTTNDSLSNAIVFAMQVKNNVLVAGSNKGMFRSTDNGNTWTRITTGFPSSALSIFVFSLAISGNNIVAAVRTDVSLQSGIYYSTNEGLSWTLSNLSFGVAEAVGSNGDLTCLTVISTVGTQDGLYRSTNGGITWVQNIFYFNNPDVQEIVGSGDKWMMSTLFSNFRSLNNGYDWFFNFLPCGSVWTYTLISDNVFAGNCEGMYRSQSWGGSWENINTGFPTVFDVEASCINETYIFAGTSDHAVWRRPLSDFGLTGIKGNTSIIPQEYLLSQNYPNPFNPETHIDFTIPEENKVSLKIYNSIGKEINTLVNEIKKPGNYSVTFNATNLSSGIYFYKLSSGNFIQTKRMILLK